MKKLILVLAAVMFLFSVVSADNNTAVIAKEGKFDAYFQVASTTKAIDRDLKKFIVWGPKELGVSYGLNQDWSVGGSMQFMVDTLAYPDKKDSWVAYKGPLTLFGQYNLRKVDLAGLNGVDMKVVLSYDLLPFMVDFDKKALGDEGNGGTGKFTDLKVALKGSKEVVSNVIVGASVFVVSTTIQDDPDNNLEYDYKNSNALGYTLGADYVINETTCAYLTLEKTLDSNQVKKGNGGIRDEKGSIVWGAKMAF